MTTRSLALVAALVAAVFVSAAPPASAACGSVPMALHRGASDFRPYSENTYRADVSAWRAGADYVENDLRWTRDGAAVMLHDPTVDRTTNGTGLLSAMTARRARALRTDDGQRLPFLASILRAARANRGGVVIEIKTRLTDRQAAKVVRKVREFGMTRRVVFTVWTEGNARQIESRDRRMVTARYGDSRTWRKTVGSADLFVLRSGAMTAETVASLRAEGVGVLAPGVWTPGARTLAETFTNLNRIGVDLVLTAETRWYVDWRAAGCPPV